MLLGNSIRLVTSYAFSGIPGPLELAGAGLQLNTVMGCLRDPANVHQTSSKCRPIQNTRDNAGRLVCRTFAGSCKHSIRLMVSPPRSIY